MRWQHPERGLLGPFEFVPIAEDSGLITPMGDWVVQEACRAAAAWPDGLHVSVNLSPRQIGPRLVDVVSGALAGSGLDPARLALEITEGVLPEDSETARATLKALRGLGTDADDSAIVSAVAGMAGSLGLTIIAEGVETPAQVEELRRLECQRAQGYHFARPLAPDAFARLVAATRPAPRAVPGAATARR